MTFTGCLIIFGQLNSVSRLIVGLRLHVRIVWLTWRRRWVWFLLWYQYWTVWSAWGLLLHELLLTLLWRSIFNRWIEPLILRCAETFVSGILMHLLLLHFEGWEWRWNYACSIVGGLFQENTAWIHAQSQQFNLMMRWSLIVVVVRMMTAGVLRLKVWLRGVLRRAEEAEHRLLKQCLVGTWQCPV